MSTLDDDILGDDSEAGWADPDADDADSDEDDDADSDDDDS